MSNLKPRSISFPCIKIEQPIGTIFLGSIDNITLCTISFYDVRRIEREDREVERYLGIQRPLNEKRVANLQRYVNFEDACFPTAVILAVDGACANYDETTKTMTLSELIDVPEGEKPVKFEEIAKVLDGQHRIEGLRSFQGNRFDVNVSIFVDIDIASQAYIFSTVNLEQTKVNKSLAYDLFELAKSRSPQKTCHNIVVALNQLESSPFHLRIKRLGVATEGVFSETLTQATFVASLLPYLSLDPMWDRNLYLRGKKPEKAEAELLDRVIFRNMFLEEKDVQISDVIFNYFEAVRQRWPAAWKAEGTGMILNRTNGFRALMRFLRPAYLFLTRPGNVPTVNEFLTVFKKILIEDRAFSVDNYKPGTAGESKLFRDLMDGSGVKP